MYLVVFPRSRMSEWQNCAQEGHQSFNRARCLSTVVQEDENDLS
jgi:hypothetical protein